MEPDQEPQSSDLQDTLEGKNHDTIISTTDDQNDEKNGTNIIISTDHPPISSCSSFSSSQKERIVESSSTASQPPSSPLVVKDIDPSDPNFECNLPDYHSMVVMLAMRGLKEVGGSTEEAILEYSERNIDEDADPELLRLALKKLAKDGRITVNTDHQNCRYFLVSDHLHDPFYKPFESNMNDDELSRLLRILKFEFELLDVD